MNDELRITFQRTVDSYYHGNFAAGAAACDRLLSRDDLEPDLRAAVLRNSVFYAPTIDTLIPQASFKQLRFPVPAGWNSYNPSIHATSDGFVCAVRSSNWEFKRHEYFRVFAEDGIPRTRSYLVSLDPRLEVEQIVLLKDETGRPDDSPSWTRGYEDLRLFDYGGRIAALATTRDLSPGGVAQMVLLEISGDTLQRVTPLSDGASRDEKNWSPVSGRNELYMLHSYAPTTVMHWDGRLIWQALPHQFRAPAIAADFRGGSPLVAVDSTYLTIVHAGADRPDGSRVYLHRFVSLDETFSIVGISRQFIFRQQGIEFAAGLAIAGDEAVVSYGVSDKESWLASVPLSSLMGLLSRPPASIALDSGPSTEDGMIELAPIRRNHIGARD